MAYVAVHHVVHLLEVEARMVAKVAVDEPGVGKESGAEGVQPVGTGGGVVPREVHQVGNAHVVTRPEERQGQHVLL